MKPKYKRPKMKTRYADLRDAYDQCLKEIKQLRKERDDWKERYEELADSLLEENL